MSGGADDTSRKWDPPARTPFTSAQLNSFDDWQGIAQPALPPMLFTNAMHLRLSLLAGGWGGNGYTSSQHEPGDYEVDYVKVWKLN